MRFQVINNYATTLEAAIGTGDTELNLASVAELPDVGINDPVALTIVPAGALEPALSEVEIIHVTAVDSGAGTVTVTRGENGTSAKTWDSGTPVECRLPAGVINKFLQAVPWEEQKQANENVDPNGFWLAHFPGPGKGPEANSAFVLGSYGRATGTYAFAAGYNAQATAFGAWAIGYNTQCSGIYAIGRGQGVEASGYASQAFGGLTTASADYAHAHGYDSTASAAYAHAEGWSTEATAKAAHAEGYNARANAEAAHAEGKRSVAQELASRAGGLGSYAMQPYADTQGAFYYENSPYVLTNHFALRQPLTAQTSDDTQTSMTPGVYICKPQAGPYNAGSAFSLRGRVVASGGGYFAHWTLDAFAIHAGGTYGSLEAQNVTQEGYTGGASAWGVALSMSSGKLYIDVTGAAGTDINWCALLYGPQLNILDAGGYGPE